MEEALAGVTNTLQERMASYQENLNQQMDRYLRAMAPRQQQQQQQTRKPGIPDFPEFSEMDQYSFHKTLKEQERAYQQNYQRAMSRIDQLERAAQERQYQERYYDYFNRGIQNAVKTHEVFQDDKARDFLEHQLAAKINYSGGRLDQINIAQVAKEVNDFLTSWQAKSQAPAMPGQPAAPGQPPGQRPVKGAPSKAGTQSKGATNFAEFEAAFERDMLPMMEAFRREKLGEE
jgi:hypothetical protein